jgi:hypothetical protein
MFYFFASGQQAVKPADILPKSFWTRWSAKQISEKTDDWKFQSDFKTNTQDFQATVAFSYYLVEGR